MKRGSIYFYKNYMFEDGGVADKLFVALNTVQRNEDEVIFAITTSRQKHRSPTPGCCIYNYCFMLSSGVDWFDKDTWVILEKVFVFTKKDIINDTIVTKKLEHRGDLTEESINYIIACCQHSPDIERCYKKKIGLLTPSDPTNSN